MYEDKLERFPLSVAIQGGYGAFHEIAARKFFEGEYIEIVPCDTFEDLFDALEDGQADCAMMAIENSVAGSILANYRLLHNSRVKIYGELYLRIKQNLMAFPGQTIDDIQEIRSHDIALQQCQQFITPLRKRGARIVVSKDTALSAKEIKEEELLGVAAIASTLAADMYGLEILAEDVEMIYENFTRFLMITNKQHIKELHKIITRHKNKASICFRLPHEEGILSKVLSVIAFYKINLSKIQSLPVIGGEGEYFFYIDLVFDEYERYEWAINAIKPLTKGLEVLGEYQQGEKYIDTKFSKKA